MDEEKSKPAGAAQLRRKGGRRLNAEQGLEEYRTRASNELRALLRQKRWPQKTLAIVLTERGIPETDRGLSAKLRRGTFSAAYYLAVKEIIETS